ncbi:MAG: hypothetical protein Q8T11_00120 [Elusimicrobiota bacterium]|nr:hypothetical protein [Elusimicrobiota bacterium]
MKIVKGAVVFKLGRPPYGAEALAAGALALGTRAQVFVDETKKAFSVEIRPAAALPASGLLALAGEFLNEALNHEYRQRVVQANAPLTQAVFAPLFAKGFPAVPADPLEELEPQVKADRARELEELLERARGMR